MQINLFNRKKLVILEQEVKALRALQQQYVSQAIVNAGTQFINDSIAKFPDWNVSELTNKYVTSDHVYSVVNKIAETSSLIPFYSYVKKEDKSLKKYKSLTNRQFYTSKGLLDARLVQVKALEEAPEDDPLNTLLDEPNPYTNKAEFFLAAYAYYLLNGECFIWKEILGDGNNKGKVKYLHIWEPENVVMHVTRTFPQTITGFSYVIGGKTIVGPVPVTDVIHWKKFNPMGCSWNGDNLRGLSPLKALTNTLTELEEADKRTLSQVKNGGLPGIVYDEHPEAATLNQDVFDAQKKAFYDFVTDSENTGAPFFVGTKKGYVATGLKMADMELLELGKVNFKRVCNVYKISDILFNSDVAATESNVNEMIKQMYTNACLPMIYSLRDALTKELAADFARFVDVDISNITELQDDLKAWADTMAALPITLTGNEIREVMHYERIEDENMDKPLVKQGYSFLEDVGVADINPDDLPLPAA